MLCAGGNLIGWVMLVDLQMEVRKNLEWYGWLIQRRPYFPKHCLDPKRMGGWSWEKAELLKKETPMDKLCITWLLTATVVVGARAASLPIFWNWHSVTIVDKIWRRMTLCEMKIGEQWQVGLWACRMKSKIEAKDIPLIFFSLRDVNPVYK